MLMRLSILLQRGGIAHTTRRLNVARPTVDGVLEHLHGLFGSPLLMHSSRNVAPARHTLRLRPHVHRVLTSLARILRPHARFHPCDASHIFHVVASSCTRTALMPGLMGTLHSRTPGIVLSFLAPSSISCHSVRRKQISLTVGHFGRVPRDFRRMLM